MKNFETNEELIFGLIIDDLDQTITPENKQILDHWRNTDLANEKTYQDFLNVQINIDKLCDRLDIDAERSWESLDKKIEVNKVQPEAAPVLKIRRSNNYWLKIAASLLILCSLGTYFIMRNRDVVVATDNYAAITSVLLPDGTEVKLNAATTISYNKDSFLKDRKLQLLHGEVFIKVAHRQASQFRVDMGDVEAKDIGTSFNIGKNDQHIAIVVEEGKVAFRQHTTAEQVLLTPGKLGLYDLRTKTLIAMNNTNPNYKAWVDKNFVFTETSFATVVSQLEKAYQTHINIKGEELKNRKLTANLKYQTVDSALAVISASLQCKVAKSKDTYILYDN